MIDQLGLPSVVVLRVADGLVTRAAAATFAASTNAGPRTRSSVHSPAP